jgi:hypothetical protein
MTTWIATQQTIATGKSTERPNEWIARGTNFGARVRVEPKASIRDAMAEMVKERQTAEARHPDIVRDYYYKVLDDDYHHEDDDS